MRYLVLGFFLALAACGEPPAPPVDPTTKLETVTPKGVVLIGGCEYYRFHNNHGDTYTPKMTPQNALSGQQTGGFNRCYAQ